MNWILAVLVSAAVCYPAPLDNQNILNINAVPTAIIMSCQGWTIFMPPCLDASDPECPDERNVENSVSQASSGACSIRDLSGAPQLFPGFVCTVIDDIPPPGAAFMFCVKGGEALMGSAFDDPNQPCGSDIRAVP